MSEFECVNGHLSKAGPKCSECGARILRIDGLTAGEERRMEAAERRREEESEGEGDE